ncbi:WD40 repeat protein [Chitinophaga niastensis]|uniref:WD40 repeat protein n=1 Tax=Chitinophaga niastensis TaxID=536980 RepID=A0A2P8HNW8_CHINA|nr:OmpA family protein [Chitinophaga niastensis]PSL47914.1 WD40 repeat protein [Chitinophaga niastensis]
MKKVCVILILCLQAQYIWAQEQKSLEQQATIYYLQHDYARAANLYKRLAQKKKVKIKTLERLADCYRQTNAYTDAAGWYGKLVTMPDTKPEDGLYYGDMLKSLGRYEEAKTAYTQYAQKNNQPQQVANRIAGCDAAMQWIQHPTRDDIRNVTRLNTTKSDWGATWYPKGIVFMSDSLLRDQLAHGSEVDKNKYGRTNYSYYKLYLADSSNYGNVYLSDLSATFNQYRYHVGPVTFDKGYQTAWFTVTDPDRRIAVQKEKIEKVVISGSRRLELYSSRKDSSGKWMQPTAFAYNQPDKYSVGHAALSKDGSILYFASDMPGGQGGTDIWYSERQTDGNWGTPQNCGPAINTSEEEEFPTIAPDGNLYFSSKGLVGMGGFDIFKANGSKAQWSTPENLHYPMNTSGDDFYFVSREDGSGYLSSNRTGGKGDDDIYAWHAPETPSLTPITPPALQIPFEGTVCPRYYGACIYLYNRQRGIGWCFMADPGRTISIMLETETDYVIRITPNGNRAKDSIEFNTRGLKGPDVLKKDICPENKMKAGAVFIIKNLYYDFNKSNIRPDAALVLDSLAEVLRSHPTVKIELGAHTDSRGSNKYNLQLSQQRANAAVKYLVGRGISRNRLVAKGYGATQLLNRCRKGVACSEEEQQENRRTAIKVLRE